MNERTRGGGDSTIQGRQRRFSGTVESSLEDQKVDKVRKGIPRRGKEEQGMSFRDQSEGNCLYEVRGRSILGRA